MRPGVSRLLNLCVLDKFYARFSQDAQVTETLHVSQSVILPNQVYQEIAVDPKISILKQKFKNIKCLLFYLTSEK